MSTKSEQNVRVHNARMQPVELHLPGRMVVLSPAAAAELAPEELACPQVQVLLRHRLIRVEATRRAPSPEPAAAGSRGVESPGAGSPDAESSGAGPTRRRSRGPSNVEGDK